MEEKKKGYGPYFLKIGYLNKIQNTNFINPTKNKFSNLNSKNVKISKNTEFFQLQLTSHDIGTVEAVTFVSIQTGHISVIVVNFTATCRSISIILPGVVHRSVNRSRSSAITVTQMLTLTRGVTFRFHGPSRGIQIRRTATIGTLMAFVVHI